MATFNEFHFHLLKPIQQMDYRPQYTSYVPLSIAFMNMIIVIIINASLAVSMHFEDLSLEQEFYQSIKD